MALFEGSCYAGRHKFEAVYDEEPLKASVTVDSLHGQKLRDLFVVKKYIKHICNRCGKEIAR